MVYALLVLYQIATIALMPLTAHLVTLNFLSANMIILFLNTEPVLYVKIGFPIAIVA